MKIERVAIEAIEISKERRKTNPEVVSALVASMRVIGQLQPITVYEKEGAAHLIAGRHRLEAADFLGWDDIEAVFVTGDEIDRRLREISENLHRAELTVQERSEQVAEWTDLIDQKNKLVQVGPVSKGGRGKEGGERKAARELNLTRQDVRRARQIASIAPEAKQAAKEARLDDNQAALTQIAKEPTPERQVAKVLEFKERGKVDDRTWRDVFLALWAKGTEDDHRWARDYIDQPIMDRRHK